ncbi:MAG: tetratricopeptide repeat protein [Gammaproteobacteria bacterium]|nr:tetratricopeptide repeat protein [Gammaproteobacteria bacterium]
MAKKKPVPEEPLSFMARLKRHHIFRVASAYAVAAYVLILVANAVFPDIGLSRSEVRYIIAAAALLFPVALVLGWMFIPPSKQNPDRFSHWQQLRFRLGSVLTVVIVVLVTLSGIYLWHINEHYIKVESVAKTATTPAPSTATAIPTKSIAVLPFENLSTDKNNAYFSAGIQDEILTRLAKIHALKVISRTSTLKYASQPENLKRVGTELGVATVLEGSVQRAGEQVRVNVQLIDASDDSHLWAETYDRDLKNIFSAETDIATKVAVALQAQLLPKESAGIASIPTQDPVAYDLFLKAEYLLNTVSSEAAKDPDSAVNQAVALYTEALQHDPRFILAYAHRSFIQSFAYWFGYGGHRQTQIVQARNDAMKALALNPEDPEAQLAMGYVYYYGERNYPKALAEFTKAGKSLPNNPNVIVAIAYIQRRQGKIAETIPDIRRALVIDPRNVSYPLEIGNSYKTLGRYREAEAEYKLALELVPGNHDVLANLIMTLILEGKFQAAQSTLASTHTVSDPQGSIALTAYDFMRLHRNPDGMLVALATAPVWSVYYWTHGEVPSALLRGDAYSMAKDGTKAASAYAEAARLLYEARQRTPEDSGVWRALSELNVALGKNTEALEAAQRALALLPVSKDAIVGTFNLYNLATIKIRIGNISGGLSDLEQLLRVPHGQVISAAYLRLDPDWDTVRQDQRFKALLKKYANDNSNSQGT